MNQSTSDRIINSFFTTFRLFKQKLDWANPLYHLPLAQMEALRFVDEQKKVLMKDLADFLAITPPSATSLVNSLAGYGYIERHFDKNDRRTVHLSLTKKGQNALSKSLQERCKKFKKLLGNLSSKEQTEFLKILEKMSAIN